MIRCSACGTMNEDGRRTCVRCGAPLPGTEIKCPRCGALNPVGNTFCDRCHARLISEPEALSQEPPSPAEDQPAIRGLSLPSRSGEEPSSSEDGTALPDWLRELSEESEELFEAEEETVPPPDEPVIEQEALPEWLRGETLGELSDSKQPSELEESLDWLSGAFEETPALGESIPEDVASAAEEEMLAEETLPDWLSSAFEEVATSGEGDSEEGAVLAAEEEQPVEEALPDWLRATFEEVSAFEESVPAEAAPADEDTLPDWLSGASEEFEGTMPEEQVSSTEGALPEWLQEIGAANISSVDSTSGPTLSDDETPSVPLESVSDGSDAETLDWLAGLGETASAPEPEAASLETASPEAAPSAEQRPARPTLDETGPPEEIFPVAAGPTVFSEAEAPDWLADLEKVEPSEPEVTPVETPAPQESTPEPATHEPPEVEPLTEEDLPDWVKALAESEETAPSLPPSVEEPEVAVPQESTPVFTMEGLAEEGFATPSEGVEALPEWLQELGEPRSAQETTTGEAPPTAQLPSWLESVMPPGVATEYARAGGTVFVSEEGGDLFQAEMPPWLEELRDEEEGPRTEPAASLGPSELEGPLEGLRGTLPSLSLVDAPSEPSLSMSRLQISEAAVAQAQLWQQLLERPRGSKQTVAHAVTSRSRTDRGLKVIVALVLILSILVGGTWVPEVMAPLPAHRVPPGVAALAQAVTALQPGDTVIVATDFDAAYADEMALMAHALLEELAQREIVVIHASTLPEGLGLGGALLREAGLGPNADRSYYLPGNANGIAEFLARPETGKAMHLFLLTSQPQRLRWWVEQRQATGGKIPMSVLLSASAAPVSQPYLQASTVTGWMVGGTQLPDLYQALSGTGRQVHVPRVYALHVTQWAAAVLLILGTLYATVSRRKGAG
ncbi:MAG TPA: hypothetical protein ENL34_11465 [Chloroflexi bacterium]|nr:hypothetical protein [Chloroflexota bacterium]